MKVIIEKDYEKMSEKAASLFIEYIQSNKSNTDLNVAITAGKTPLKMYEILTKKYKDILETTQVKYHNFDEIPYKSDLSNGVTISDLKKDFFDKIKIDSKNIHHLNFVNYKDHEKYLESIGGLDLVILGIGSDGHYCGNLPGTTSFDDWTTNVIVDEAMAKRISPHFPDKNEIPSEYVTMGPRSIMQIKKLILIVNGKHKAEIMKTFMEQKLDKNIPASILAFHPDLTVIMDGEAASLIKK